MLIVTKITRFMLEFKFKRKLKKTPLLYIGKQFTYGLNTFLISSYDSIRDCFHTRCGKCWTGSEEFFKCVENGDIKIIH
jgi:hypothetical protein